MSPEYVSGGYNFVLFEYLCWMKSKKSEANVVVSECTVFYRVITHRHFILGCFNALNSPLVTVLFRITSLTMKLDSFRRILYIENAPFRSIDQSVSQSVLMPSRHTSSRACLAVQNLTKYRENFRQTREKMCAKMRLKNQYTVTECQSQKFGNRIPNWLELKQSTR